MVTSSGRLLLSESVLFMEIKYSNEKLIKKLETDYNYLDFGICKIINKIL